MNLLDRSLFTYELPWGNTVENDYAVFKEDMVEWKEGKVLFHASKKPVSGWKRDAAWNKVETHADFTFGLMVSREQYGYGTYQMRCFLPNFRGSWPSFWFIDVIDKSQGGMGIPPEIDVFEQFRRDNFLSRFRMTGTYHDGPTYSNERSRSIARVSLMPFDLYETRVKFIRTPEKMIWIINEQQFMKVERSEMVNYPDKGMNIILGAGIGQWNPQVNKFAPFEVMEFTCESNYPRNL